MMNEKEFEVLDEMYFVISYEELSRAVELSENDLKEVLVSLWNKGWLRCYLGVDNELDGDTIELENQFNKYHYLASKQGLMAHNTR